MRNMSFALTKDQVCDRSKHVTRRLGWHHAEPGEIVQAVERAQGLRKGQKVVPVARIRIVGVRRERLRRMTDDPAYGASECVLEGFPKLTPAGFVQMFCATHRVKERHPGAIETRRGNVLPATILTTRPCTPDDEITRIEFVYVEDGQ